jgi:hypothetical protein
VRKLALHLGDGAMRFGYRAFRKSAVVYVKLEPDGLLKKQSMHFKVLYEWIFIRLISRLGSENGQIIAAGYKNSADSCTRVL